MNIRKAIKEFWWFGLYQAWACLFGGLMLAAILGTYFITPWDYLVPRYDFLVFWAVFIQFSFLALKLETWSEARVILIFHIVGTVMELFKTHVGSWSYPEENYIRLLGVPLFSGFMYSAVGSYLARVWRIFDFRYRHFPSMWVLTPLCVAIYLNFFTHHFMPDIRLFLFAAIAWIFRKSFVYFTVMQHRLRMHVLLAQFLGAFFIWIAENVGTFGRVWIYPNQSSEWELVSFDKLGSWFLLMMISGFLVTLVQKPQDEPADGTPANHTP